MPSAELIRVLESLGREAFDRAADQAWAVAPFTGLAGGPERGDNSLIHEACWRIDELAPLGRRSFRKLRLWCELYELAPDYAVLMSVRWSRAHWSAAAARFFWRRYRRWLEADPALAAPVQYSLWCDWFEDPQTAAQAWRAVLTPPRRRLRVERVLDCAGPVPYPLKARIYGELGRDRSWHQAIYRSLVHSADDVYGSLDVEHARRLLAELELAADTPERDYFRDKLGWRY